MSASEIDDKLNALTKQVSTSEVLYTKMSQSGYSVEKIQTSMETVYKKVFFKLMTNFKGLSKSFMADLTVIIVPDYTFIDVFVQEKNVVKYLFILFSITQMFRSMGIDIEIILRSHGASVDIVINAESIVDIAYGQVKDADMDTLYWTFADGETTPIQAFIMGMKDLQPANLKGIHIEILRQIKKLKDSMEIKGTTAVRIAVGLAFTKDLFQSIAFGTRTSPLSRKESDEMEDKGKLVMRAAKLSENMISKYVYRDEIKQNETWRSISNVSDTVRSFSKGRPENFAKFKTDLISRFSQRKEETLYPIGNFAIRNIKSVPNESVMSIQKYLNSDQNIMSVFLGFALSDEKTFTKIKSNNLDFDTMHNLQEYEDLGTFWKEVLEMQDEKIQYSLTTPSLKENWQSLKIVDTFDETIFIDNPAFFKDIAESEDKDGEANNTLWTVGFEYSNGDIQIGVTGTCKRGEDAKDAIDRELGEELGVQFTEPQKLFEALCESNGGDQHWTVAVAHISQIRNATSKEIEMFLTEDRADDKSRKVGAMVIGSKDDIIHLIKSSIANWNNVGEIDEITSIVAMPLKFILLAGTNRKVIERDPGPNWTQTPKSKPKSKSKKKGKGSSDNWRSG